MDSKEREEYLNYVVNYYTQSDVQARKFAHDEFINQVSASLILMALLLNCMIWYKNSGVIRPAEEKLSDRIRLALKMIVILAMVILVAGILG